MLYYSSARILFALRIIDDLDEFTELPYGFLVASKIYGESIGYVSVLLMQILQGIGAKLILILPKFFYIELGIA